MLNPTSVETPLLLQPQNYLPCFPFSATLNTISNIPIHFLWSLFSSCSLQERQRLFLNLSKAEISGRKQSAVAEEAGRPCKNSRSCSVGCYCIKASAPTEQSQLNSSLKHWVFSLLHLIITARVRAWAGRVFRYEIIRTLQAAEREAALLSTWGQAASSLILGATKAPESRGWSEKLLPLLKMPPTQKEKLKTASQQSVKHSAKSQWQWHCSEGFLSPVSPFGSSRGGSGQKNQPRTDWGKIWSNDFHTSLIFSLLGAIQDLIRDFLSISARSRVQSTSISTNTRDSDTRNLCQALLHKYFKPRL